MLTRISGHGAATALAPPPTPGGCPPVLQRGVGNDQTPASLSPLPSLNNRRTIQAIHRQCPFTMSGTASACEHEGGKQLGSGHTLRSGPAGSACTRSLHQPPRAVAGTAPRVPLDPEAVAAYAARLSYPVSGINTSALPPTSISTPFADLRGGLSARLTFLSAPQSLCLRRVCDTEKLQKPTLQVGKQPYKVEFCNTLATIHVIRKHPDLPFGIQKAFSAEFQVLCFPNTLEEQRERSQPGWRACRGPSQVCCFSN